MTDLRTQASLATLEDIAKRTLEEIRIPQFTLYEQLYRADWSHNDNRSMPSNVRENITVHDKYFVENDACVALEKLCGRLQMSSKWELRPGAEYSRYDSSARYTLYLTNPRLDDLTLLLTYELSLREPTLHELEKIRVFLGLRNVG